MGETSEGVSDDKIGKFFHKHLAPLFFVFSDGTDSQRVVITAFVLSVLDHWFLITAGHCISQIDTLMSKYGYDIDRCLLIDSLGTSARHFEPIPFDYEDSSPIHFSDDQNFDYGVIYLRPYYQHLLKANGVVPFDEHVWKLQPENPFGHLLAGIPAELTVFSPELVQITATLHPVEQLNEPPPGVQEPDVPLFYGRVELGDMTDIGGTSGGPILGFSRTRDGSVRYWLIALQSRWLKSQRHITACPTRVLGEFLEERIRKLFSGLEGRQDN